MKVAEFSIEYTQYLNEAGEISNKSPDFVEKNPDLLIEFYRIMTLTRTFDTKAVALQRTGKMGTYASTLGQEAIDTALGKAMQKDDVLCPFYRDYAAQIQRDIQLAEIYRYWGGDELGSCYEHNREDLPISVPIASQCLHAAGIAYAFKLRGQARVAVSELGDGGTSQGDFYEALNVTGAWKLPAIFIINNNQWAISVPRNEQTATQTLAQKAIAAGIHGEQVDGNDVIACYDVMHRAIERARRGEGGSVIEALTYRLCDHTTADDANRYRPQAELEAARAKEPMIRLRKYLEQKNLWNQDKEQALQTECAQKVEAAVETYVNYPTQPLSSIFDFMYQQWPKALWQQREEALRWETK